MDEQDFLEHHGIKGMKWGIRRTAEQLGHFVKSGSKKVKSYLSNKKAIRKSRVRSAPKRIRLKKMSDEELKSRLERLQMEKQYRELSKQARGRGLNLVFDVLETSSKKTLTDLGTYGMTSLAKKVFKNFEVPAESKSSEKEGKKKDKKKGD